MNRAIKYLQQQRRAMGFLDVTLQTLEANKKAKNLNSLIIIKQILRLS